MAQVPTQVVIAAFHEEEAAGQVADALKEAKKQHQLHYRNVAVIRKDEKGKVKVKETGDMGGGVGAERWRSHRRGVWLTRRARRPGGWRGGRRRYRRRRCGSLLILVLTTSAWRKLATCFNPEIRPSSPFSRKSRSTRRR